MTFKAVEEGALTGKPYQLFTFTVGEVDRYYYTTADVEITIGSIVYDPAQPMESVTIVDNNLDDKGKLNFEVIRDHEIAKLFLLGSQRMVTLTIQAGHIGEAEHTNIWSGRVVACDWSETGKATLSCESVTTILGRTGLPYKFGPTCQHTLYRGGCRLDIFAYSTLHAVTAKSVTGFEITIESMRDASYAGDYDGGLLIRNDTDYRMITGYVPSTGVFSILRPFEDLEIGAVLRLARGCNRTPDRCKVLGNFEHFMGFSTIPLRNPFEGLRRAGVQS